MKFLILALTLIASTQSFARPDDPPPAGSPPPLWLNLKVVGVYCEGDTNIIYVAGARFFGLIKHTDDYVTDFETCQLLKKERGDAIRLDGSTKIKALINQLDGSIVGYN